MGSRGPGCRGGPGAEPTDWGRAAGMAADRTRRPPSSLGTGAQDLEIRPRGSGRYSDESGPPTKAAWSDPASRSKADRRRGGTGGGCPTGRRERIWRSRNLGDDLAEEKRSVLPRGSWWVTQPGSRRTSCRHACWTCDHGGRGDWIDRCVGEGGSRRCGRQTVDGGQSSNLYQNARSAG